MKHFKGKFNSLSITEKIVFNELTKPKSYAEISNDLEKSLASVKLHASNIYKKMGIPSCKAGSRSKRLVFMRLFVNFKNKSTYKKFK